MKKKTIKIIITILLALYAVLSIKSGATLKSIFTIQGISEEILISDKLFIFTSLVFSLILISILSIMVFTYLSEKRQAPRTIKELIDTKVENKKIDKISDNSALINSTIQKLSTDIDNIDNINDFANKVLSNIAEKYDIMQALFFIRYPNEDTYKKLGTYAFYSEDEIKEFTDNMGLSGQVAASRKLLNINNIPDNYIKVLSGLGKSSPSNLLIFPIVFENKSIGVIELASFQEFNKMAEDILMKFSDKIAHTIHDKYFQENENEVENEK